MPCTKKADPGSARTQIRKAQIQRQMKQQVYSPQPLTIPEDASKEEGEEPLFQPLEPQLPPPPSSPSFPHPGSQSTRCPSICSPERLHRLHRVVEKRQETPLREDRVQVEAQGSLEVRLTWGWEILAQGEQGRGFSSHLQSPHAHGSLQCQGHSCHICMAAD